MATKSTFWTQSANLPFAVSGLAKKELEQLYAELLLRRQFSKPLVDGLLADTRYTATKLYEYHQRHGDKALLNLYQLKHIQNRIKERRPVEEGLEAEPESCLS